LISLDQRFFNVTAMPAECMFNSEPPTVIPASGSAAVLIRFTGSFSKNANFTASN
jgi:hypothetical protein